MTSIRRETAVGVFSTREEASTAVERLYNAGFTAAEIGVLTQDDWQGGREGAVVGTVAGVGIGGLIGLGVLAGAVPVVGPALFGGTLGILAANAVSGAAVVGVIGALTGWGISETHAKYYEGEIVAGRTIVTVTADHPCDQARAIMQRAGAVSLDTQTDPSGSPKQI